MSTFMHDSDEKFSSFLVYSVSHWDVNPVIQK